MFKTSLPHAKTVLFTLAVTVPLHFLGGLDWQSAIVSGLVVSVVLCALIDHGTATHPHEEARP